MNGDLQRAIDCLQIQDVYLRSAESSLAEGFEPKYDGEVDALSVQFRHVVTHSNVLVLEQEEEEPVSLFRVFVELGVRWLEPGQEETEDEVEPKAYVRGVMVAEYRMTEDPGQGALKQFALRNASYHVWPYWREYLMGQCLRMNLPKLVLPAVQFAQNRASE
jgi:hypothetical protein